MVENPDPEINLGLAGARVVVVLIGRSRIG